MKTFVLEEKLANAILQYLGQQPYVAVAGMIAGLMQLKEINEATGPPLEIVPGKEKE